jgi:hypothetical protein
MRCGICDVNNICSEEYEKHFNSERHKLLVGNFLILKKITDGHISQNELLRATQKMKQKQIINELLLYSDAKTEENKKDVSRQIRKRCEILASDIYKKV